MPIIHLDLPSKFCVNIVLSIPWVLQSSQEKWMTKMHIVLQNFGRENNGQFKNGEWWCNHFTMFP